MGKPASKRTPIILGLIGALGVLFLLSAESFSRRFVAREGARLLVFVPEERLEFLGECFETRCNGKKFRARFGLYDNRKGEAVCGISVDDGSFEKSRATAQEIASGIRGDFVARGIPKGINIKLLDEPVSIHTLEYRTVTMIGRGIGVLLTITAAILGLLRFLGHRRSTPPLLPQEADQRNESAKFDY